MDNSKLITIFLGFMITILFLFILKLLHTIFIPLVFALILALMAMPIVNFIDKAIPILPRFIASTVVLVIFAWITYEVGELAYINILHFTNKINFYLQQLNQIIDSILNQLNLKHILLKTDETFDIVTALKHFKANSLINNAAQTSLSLFSRFTISMLFAFFILQEGLIFERKFQYAFKLSKNNSRIQNALESITSQISSYLSLKAFFSLLTGILIWLTARILGLTSPLTWGFLTFIFNFIPSIGSIMITIVISLMGLVQFYPAWDKILYLVFFSTAIQIIIGNFLDPKISGDRLDISPLIILISLSIWGWLWGIAGLFLAIPMTSIMKIIIDNIPDLQPLSILIGSGKKLPHKRKRRR